MRYRKNKKRIDPRYFLNETVDRVDEQFENLAAVGAAVPQIHHEVTEEAEMLRQMKDWDRSIALANAGHSRVDPEAALPAARWDFEQAFGDSLAGQPHLQAPVRAWSRYAPQVEDYVGQHLKEIIQEEIALLFEGTIPFEVVLKMAPNLPRGYAAILGKQFENTPDGRAALKRALQDGSWKGLLREAQKLFEGTIPFEVVLKMSPNLPRGYAVILGKQFENTPDGRAALKRALQDGSWKGLLREAQKASKTVGDPPYRERGSTESQAQQMAAGAALSARRGETPASKLKGAALDLYNGEITTKELRDLAKLGQKVKGHKTKEPKRRKSLPGHATPAKD